MLFNKLSQDFHSNRQLFLLMNLHVSRWAALLTELGLVEAIQASLVSCLFSSTDLGWSCMSRLSARKTELT